MTSTGSSFAWSIPRGQDPVAAHELTCHAILDGWVGLDCRAVLKINETSSATVQMQEIRSKSQQESNDHGIEGKAHAESKKRKLEVKEYSAAKECLKYIPQSIQQVSQHTPKKIKQAVLISACPTPVKVSRTLCFLLLLHLTLSWIWAAQQSCRASHWDLIK